MAIVYKHISPSGKVYIGISKNENCHRWGKNGKGYEGNTYFWKAIQKYGWNNFKHEILFNGIAIEEAELLEIKLIAEYRATEPEFGYNNCIGGNINKGYHHSSEYKNQLRQKMIGKYKGKKSPCYGIPLSEEVKQKISIAKKGIPQSISTRQKRSESLKGHIVTPETREKIRMGNKGRKKTDAEITKIKEFWIVRRTYEYKEETKEKIRQANIGKVKSQQTKNKISQSLKGRPKSEETKRKMREAKQKRKAVIENEFSE